MCIGVRRFCAGSTVCVALFWHIASHTSDADAPNVGRVSDEPRRQLGREGEQLACDHLQRLGFTVLERNYRTRQGELDVIAFDGRTLVFCEVKARRLPARAGSALASIDGRKRARVRRLATRWLRERPSRPAAHSLRFDAIGVTFDAAGRMLALEHLEDAF